MADVTTNAAEFSAALRQEMQRLTEREIVLLHKKVTLQVLDGVVRMSPVDTGRFRNAWVTSVSSPDNSQPEQIGGGAGAPPSGEQMAQALGAMTALPAFGVSFVQNNLPYAQRLEDGWSSQAPAGMVRATLERVRGQFN